jgi:hypothetical protein
MPRVAQRELEVVLEDVPDRLPVDAGGFHRDMRDPVRGQPVAQRHQTLHGGGELGQLRLATPGLVRDAHARGHLRLMDIERADALEDRLHQTSRIEHLTASPAGPSKQTSLMVVLEATVRDPGQGPYTKLVTGAQAPRAKRCQRATPGILAHFTRPRMPEGQDN